MEFEELVNVYQTVNRKCCKCGRVYSLSKDRIVPVFCDMWCCDRCRKRLKSLLYVNTSMNCLLFGLDRHFVVTVKGNDFRDLYSYEDSYVFLMYSWKRLRQMITRKYGYFDYVCFPRAQKNGYAHLHILVSKFISWRFLEDKRKKIGLGYVSINRNKSVVDYLHMDFFKDHEYYIPLGRKHYACSRNIIMDNTVKDDWWKEENQYFNTNDIEVIYDKLNNRFGRSLPFEEYVKTFYSLMYVSESEECSEG